MAGRIEGPDYRGEILLAVTALGGLLFAHQVFGYGLFHVLVELSSVVVAFAVFAITWNTRRLLSNGYLLVLGIALLYVGAVDLLHTLAYKGMGQLLGPDEIDTPTQLWLIARYLQALAMLVAPFFLNRRVRPPVIAAAFGALAFTGVASVMWWDVFPTALTATGLTPFKVWSEFIISAMLLVAAGLLWRARERFERPVLHMLLGAIFATVGSEMAFTLYVDPYGALNMIGHVLKVLAVYLIYRSLVSTALQQPYSILFRELSMREAALAESEERFRTTFEQATVGIAHIGLDGYWLRMNERHAQILGYDRDELLQMSFRDVSLPEDLAADQANFELLVAGATDEYSMEKQVVWKDGTIRWAWVRRSLVRDASGQPKYVVAITEDLEERKREEQRLQRAKALADALTRIDAEINATLDSETIVQRAMVGGAEAIGSDSAAVMLRQNEMWVGVAAHHLPLDILGRPFSDTELPEAALAAQRLAPVAISETGRSGKMNTEVSKYGIRSVLVVPLISKGECTGAVYFNFHHETHWFTEDEMEFSTSLASALSLATENAILYNAQRKIADTLQSALLYMPGSLPRVDLAAAYRASTELSRIGGDFYDAFDMGGGKIAFALGDVSGKGLDAATITAAARSTIRAFAYAAESPAEVLRKASDVLERQISDDRFVTVIFGTLDTGSGELTICSAGHPEPVLCGPSECRYLEIPLNPPLGAFPQTRFEQATTALAPGEMIVLYSDGVLDARRGDDFFGEERLREVLRKLGAVPTGEVVHTTLQAVDDFAGGARTDDAAVAAFRLISSHVTEAALGHMSGAGGGGR